MDIEKSQSWVLKEGQIWGRCPGNGDCGGHGDENIDIDADSDSDSDDRGDGNERKSDDDGDDYGYGCDYGYDYYDDYRVRVHQPCVVDASQPVYWLNGDLDGQKQDEKSGLADMTWDDCQRADRRGRTRGHDQRQGGQ